MVKESAKDYSIGENVLAELSKALFSETTHIS
jgi:hypothetical protein